MGVAEARVRTEPTMAEPGGVPLSMQDWLAQLRAFAEGLSRLPGAAGLPALPSVPALPPMPPMPGALTAAQLDAIASGIAAQREGIAAMRSQLKAFDEQLAVLEEVVGPFTEWSRTWATAEKRVTGRS